MNFIDPFADDIKNVSAARTRGAAASPPAPLSGTSATGPTELPGRGRDALAEPATAFAFDVSSAPGARRRRRAGDDGAEGGRLSPEPVASPPFATQLGRFQPTETRRPAGTPQTPVAAVAAAASSPTPARVTGAAEEDMPWLATAAVPARQPPQRSSPAPPQADKLTIDSDDPLAFLEANATARAGGGGGGGGGRSTPSTAGPAAVSGATGSTNGADAARKAEAELRELYAQLHALSEEQTKLEEKLALQETKEEGELLSLETTVVQKKMELEQKSSELAGECDRVRASTAQRLTAVRGRYAEELSEQAAQTRRLESDRYTRQLTLLEAGVREVEESLTKLTEQKQLLLDADPFSPKGILLTLTSSDALPTSVTGSGPAAEAAESAATGTEHADASAASSSFPSYEESPAPGTALEDLLQRGVRLVAAYCDRHLRPLKDTVVDCVHTETLRVAHETRTSRALGWGDEVVQRKEQLGQHVQDMMLRYLDLTRARDAHKRSVVQTLHEELQATTAQLRQEAAARLKRLTTEVTARLAATTSGFERVAREHAAELHKKIGQTINGDAAAEAAQVAEATHRREAEGHARRQLQTAAKDGLANQLRAMRATARAHAASLSRSLLEAAGNGSQQLCEPLRARMADLQHLAGALAAAEREAQQRREQRPWTEPTHRLANDGRACLSELTAVAERTQSELLDRRQRYRELCTVLCEELLEHVAALRERRLAQQSSQSAIAFTRAAWEREHQHNLRMAARLEVPVAVPGDHAGRLLAVETYAAPGDATALGLLEMMTAALQEQSQHRQQLCRRRATHIAAAAERLSALSRQMSAAAAQWATLLGTADSMASAQETIARQEVAVHKERADMEADDRGIALQREVVARRRAVVARESAAYQSEDNAVRAAHDATRAALTTLSAQQIQLALDSTQTLGRRAPAGQLAPQSPSSRPSGDTTRVLRDCTNDATGQKATAKSLLNTAPETSAAPARVLTQRAQTDTATYDDAADATHTPRRHRTTVDESCQWTPPPLSPTSTPPSLARRREPGERWQEHPHAEAVARETAASAQKRVHTTRMEEKRQRPALSPSPSPRERRDRAGDEAAPASSHSGSGSRATGVREGMRGGSGHTDSSSPVAPDSSWVSVSSFYQSNTFVDLVTVQDSTSTSAVDTL